MTIGGIYEILNTANGKRYIGSAVDLKRRFRKHRAELKRKSHHSVKLQHAWDKYGESAFKFLPILTCAPSMLLFYEQQLLDKVKPEYNIAPTAGSALGRKHTKASKLKMSESSRGKPKSSEHRATMSRTRKGIKHPRTPEHQAKLAATQVGKKRSTVVCAHQSAAHLGKPLSLDHRVSIGRGNKGKKRTTETRKRMSKAQEGNKKNVGRIFSAETREKISRSNRRTKAYQRLMAAQGPLA